MIYCVRFSEVVARLTERGFREVGRTETSILFGHPDGDRVVIHAPNLDGNIPEALVDDAFDSAGLIPPSWSVFWCD